MPLTTRGISLQILASIRAHREHPADCTVNDCKVVVNHLIRKFSEPDGAPLRLSVAVRAGANGNTVRDHAVPVIVLLEQLLTLEPDRLAPSDENIRYVEDFLRASIYVVEITDEEDLHLCTSGYQRRMPMSWSTEGHELHRQPFARYMACGIEVWTD